MDFEGSKISTLDIIVIGAYFLSVIGVGGIVSYTSKNNTSEEFFLGGRQFNWVLVGLSLFVSNIGSEHFIGFAGSGALRFVSNSRHLSIFKFQWYRCRSMEHFRSFMLGATGKAIRTKVLGKFDHNRARVST